MTVHVPSLWLTALIAGLLPAMAAAQSRATTGDLAGAVFDQSGAVLPGAAVTATDRATNLTRTTVSGTDGRFLIPALQPGTYHVETRADSFAAQTSDVTVTLGSLIELNFTLRLAGIEATVAVVGSAPVVDTQRTAVSTIVSQPFIEGLPINGRNFISFSVIAPGVADDRTPQQGASATSGLTFAGQRGRANNITVDGVDNNDPITGGVRATFSQEAVQEFQVLANSFSAEFGKASGGVVNIVTKSGTNAISGDGFFFFRDAALNAKQYFEQFTPSGAPIDQPKAPYGQKQFGGVVGGPIQRDKTFYFLSFERLDIQANNFVTINDSNIVSVFGQLAGTAVDILRRNGFPVDTGHVPYDVRSDQFLAKTDYRRSAEQNLNIRFNWASTLNENVEPWGGQIAKSRGAFLDSDDAMLAASYMSVHSSKAVNELRGQIAYRNQGVFSLDPSCGGRCVTEDQGGPTVEVSGVASVGRQRFTPQLRKNIRYQALETFSYFTKAHSFKFGVDFSDIDFRSGSLPLHFGGRFIFTALPAIPGVLPAPVSSIQALALGLPAAYVQGYGNSQAAYPYRDASVFAQDDWTPARDLNVKLGLRYQKQFWHDSQYTAPHVGTYKFPSDNNNVAPRLAVAWNPWHDSGRTSLHGAYGIYYDNQLTSLIGVSDILNGHADGLRTLVLRFPNSVTAWRAPGKRLPEPTTPYPTLVYVPDPSLKTPYAHHVNVGVNRELPWQAAFSANVVYVRGLDQVGTLDYNPLVPALGAGRRPDDLVDPATGTSLAGTSTTVLQPTSFGETWYRGLTMSLRKRLGERSEFLASYALSKAEDNSTDFQSDFIPQNTGRGRDPNNPTGLPLAFDASAEKGPSVQDQRHRFVFSALYALPRGLDISSIVTIGSGRPFNILAGADLDGNGDGGAFPADRARTAPSDPATSVGRNAGTLPSQAIVDLRVKRRFRLAGRTQIDGIFEVFNLFNRTNFTAIDSVFGSGAYPANPLPTFGQFQQAGAPRQVQLAAKVTF